MKDAQKCFPMVKEKYKQNRRRLWNTEDFIMFMFLRVMFASCSSLIITNISVIQLGKQANFI